MYILIHINFTEELPDAIIHEKFNNMCFLMGQSIWCSTKIFIKNRSFHTVYSNYSFQSSTLPYPPLLPTPPNQHPFSYNTSKHQKYNKTNQIKIKISQINQQGKWRFKKQHKKDNIDAETHIEESHKVIKLETILYMQKTVV